MDVFWQKLVDYPHPKCDNSPYLRTHSTKNGLHLRTKFEWNFNINLDFSSCTTWILKAFKLRYFRKVFHKVQGHNPSCWELWGIVWFRSSSMLSCTVATASSVRAVRHLTGCKLLLRVKVVRKQSNVIRIIRSEGRLCM